MFLFVLFFITGSSVRTTRRHSTANANRPKYRSKTSEDYDNAEVQARTSTKQRATTARPNYKYINKLYD